MRVQLALNVRDLARSVDFYSKMFGTTPAKIRPGYANFAVEDPPLKLVLFESPAAEERINHLGVEVFDQAEVETAKLRLAAANLERREQKDVTCCYARQSKVWVKEPDGIPWEWYRVIDGDASAD